MACDGGDDPSAVDPKTGGELEWWESIGSDIRPDTAVEAAELPEGDVPDVREVIEWLLAKYEEEVLLLLVLLLLGDSSELVVVVAVGAVDTPEKKGERIILL